MNADTVRARAAGHGVQAVLHAMLASSDWPTSLLQQLRAEALQRAMWELRHQQLLSSVIGTLHAAGVDAILIKGTALAYSIYADPVLRTRADTDLIIASEHKQQAHDLLTGLGFEQALGVSGEVISYQANYTRTEDGAMHALDLHWKINNSEVLSKLFEYEELRRDAQPLPGLCPHALGASRIHSLLLACMHRAHHKQSPYFVDGDLQHDAANRLIWLLDIHLLALQFGEAEWESFVKLATRKGLREVCLDGLRSTQFHLHTAYPANVLPQLALGQLKEVPALYLDGSRLQRLRMDFFAHARAGTQLRFLRELLFPPAAYMREKFGGSAKGLPWLYLRRACMGLWRRMTPRTRGS